MFWILNSTWNIKLLSSLGRKVVSVLANSRGGDTFWRKNVQQSIAQIFTTYQRHSDWLLTHHNHNTVCKNSLSLRANNKDQVHFTDLRASKMTICVTTPASSMTHQPMWFYDEGSHQTQVARFAFNFNVLGMNWKESTWHPIVWWFLKPA